MFNKLYVDLDGVIANWERGVVDLLGLIDVTTSNYFMDPYNERYYNAIAERMREGKGFWSDLPPYDDALDLWESLKPYTPIILTAVGNPCFNAAEQKLRWVWAWLGPATRVVTVRCSVDKYNYAVTSEGSNLLIDDQQRVIHGWELQGGLGILHTCVHATLDKFYTILCPTQRDQLRSTSLRGMPSLAERASS